jgi:two-component system chemotaxis response regulator CheV
MTSTLQARVCDSAVLLEAGTNEVEILVFVCGGSRFGVNVAKVREVLRVGEVTAIKSAHPAVEGVVRIRDLVVSLVNLSQYLFPGEAGSVPVADDQMLLLEFNREQIAFRVQRTERIHRLSWTKVVPVPQLLGANVPVSAVLELQGDLVPMLDFESIGDKLGMLQELGSGEAVGQERLALRALRPIAFADDSSMVRARLRDEMKVAGYTSVRVFADGMEACQYLSSLGEDSPAGEASSHVAGLITDVEMPRMDGLTLTRHVRQHPLWKDLPVVIFSSIASKDNEKKGTQVGATAQVIKPH